MGIKSKMKILILQPWISYRGAESVSVNFCYWLNKLGHQAKIAAIFIDWERLPDKGDKIEYILPPRALSEICKKSRFFLFILGPALLFWITLKQIKKIEVLNPHNLPSVWIASILGKLFSKTVVWTAHGVPQSVSWRDKRSLFEYLVWKISSGEIDRWLVRKVDLIVAVSKKVAKDVEKRYARDSVIIHPGVIKTRGKVSTLSNRLIALRKKHQLLLLQVGNLHLQKRQFITLDVVKKLNSTGINTAVIFVGGGPDKNKLKVESGKLKLGSKVYFAGFVPQEKIGAYYAFCDLNLLPSVAESFPATPPEALLHGKMSVVSSETGTSEVISDFVLVAKPNARDFTDKINQFVKRRKYYEGKAKKGKEFILESLTWERYCQRFVASIDEPEDIEILPSIYDKNYFKVHHESPASKTLIKERKVKFNRALKLARIKPGLKILDLGCGNGEEAVRLARAGLQVWGVDYSKDAISLARERRGKQPKEIARKLHFSLADAKELKFSSDFFDRCICLDVFEHIYPKTLERVITEIKRVMKPGGLVVVKTTPNRLFYYPFLFMGKKIFGINKLESEGYHINISDYFRLKKILMKIGPMVTIDVVNDGHRFFSSRISRLKLPGWGVVAIRMVDFLHENPVSEAIILSTPLKLFLAHDLWGVVDVNKEKEK